jgi:putative ABC transport system substrate-binding protein
MKRRTCLATAAVAMPWPVRVAAQARARRIGLLIPGPDPGGLGPGAAEPWKRLGWTVGESLIIEPRYAGWQAERMPELADELVQRQGVELLIAIGGDAAAAAARATRTAPIVFAWGFLPIECGLIDSYARPGRNATGVASIDNLDLSSKRMEFLRLAVPLARRMAFLGPDMGQFTVSGKPLDIWTHGAAAAKAQGFEHSVHIARRIEDVDGALDQAAAAGAQAVFISGSSYSGAASRVTSFALRRRWASTTASPHLLAAGLLIYYGTTGAEDERLWVRVVQIADRILRGASPAEIPVELPTRYGLALNLKTARALGLTLPQTLILQSDKVIE